MGLEALTAFSCQSVLKSLLEALWEIILTLYRFKGGPTWPQDGAKLVVSWRNLGEVGVKLAQVGAKLAQVGTKLSQIVPSWPKMGRLRGQSDEIGSKKPPQKTEDFGGLGRIREDLDTVAE